MNRCNAESKAVAFAADLLIRAKHHRSLFALQNKLGYELEKLQLNHWYVIEKALILHNSHMASDESYAAGAEIPWILRDTHL